MRKPILQVEHLSMQFGGLIAIGDLSFEAKRGEITALIGPNGAGKTTVFNCITGFYKPTEGMIRCNSHDGREFLLERMHDFQITAKAKVARTFQNIRLFQGMTLLENLLVAQHNKLMKASSYTVLGLFGLGSYRQASAEAVELAKHWLEKTELIDRADDPAGGLSYGAQRRLEIARAMCTGPELLCLDEPAAGLNPNESLTLNTLLNDIKDTTGTSILLIEHDMSVVMRISDHVVVLEYGRKISDGDPTSVRTDPKVIAAYLGIDDDEVGEVLVEVGAEQIMEEFEGLPDPAHGPSTSSSMMAGPIIDTVGHSDDHSETVPVSRAASRAAQVEAIAILSTIATSAKPPSKAKVKKVPATGLMSTMAATATVKAAAKPAVAKESVKPTAKSVPVKTTRAAKTIAKMAPVANATAVQSKTRLASRPAPSKSSEANAILASKASTKVTTAKTTTPKPATAKPVAAKSATAKSAAPKTIANVLAVPRGGVADRLIDIKGIRPFNEKKLNDHGIFHFDQIASWKKADIAAAEAYLAVDGRIDREDWVGQAKVLARESVQLKKAKHGSGK